MRRRLILCSLLVALVGLSSALLVYLTASGDGDLEENVQTVVVDGKTYQIPLASTKMYRRDLQRFGGGAAVLFDDLERWFSNLWRGRALGVTLAWITAFVSIGLFLLARQVPRDLDPGARGGDRDSG